MKSLSLKTVGVLCAAASAATIACAAMAQDGPPPPGGPGGGQFAQGHGGGRGDPGQRLQELHDSLQLSPAQEPAFQAWQAALRPTGPMVRPGGLRRMTTPQRLDEEIAQQTEQTTELKARVAATKSFYNQLSATQRQTLDGLPPQELLAMEAFGGGGRGGRGGRRGGGGGGFDPNAGFGGQQNFGPPPAQ
jgi:protein CpxP